VKQNEATVKQVETGAEAIELLNKYPDRYQGVILDFNCIIKKGEEATNEFLSFMQKRIFKIDESIPVVVLSGNIEAERRAAHEEIKFFKKYDTSKERGPEQCIDYLIKRANDLEITKLKNKFADVFEVFIPKHGHLGADSEKKFIEFLRRRNTTDIDEIRQNFWASRELLTDIYAAMANKKPDVIPESMRKTDYELGNIIKHFLQTQESGARKHNDYAVRSVTDTEAYMINNTSNICGLHKQGDYEKSAMAFDATFEPTQYTHKMVIFGICDYLLWFKGWMDKNAK
jgi:CheY-like chemotaxis protein